MSNQLSALSLLIDVIALSKKHCQRPIQANLAYATRENFTARPVNGYTKGLTDLALMTKDAATALCEVQNELLQQHNLGLLIYDSYRPKRAVLDFVAWSKQAVADDEQGRYELERKQIHYPRIKKNQMFELQYVAEDSQHCYGHTVDLVLINEKNQELDLGACFDFMDTLSHITMTAAEIGETALQNRNILSSAMKKHGFLPYPYEFWHFSFHHQMIKEPMDLAITPVLKGLNVK
jgi:zinc D-Ala-D-Ala dipeptidase